MKKTKKSVCASCPCADECAVNNWSLFDPWNTKCPNYRKGTKQYKSFLSEYFESEE